jgi:ABC-type polysaccharide/polyol phosphate export permease
VLIVLNLTWIALFLGMLSARFRDIPQLVINLVQVSFFLSPVLWKADMLSPDRKFLANYNPLYHFMEVVRAPLLGESLSLLSCGVCIALLVIGGGATFYFFSNKRVRIPYWL